jgi:Helix-turn-helix domain
VNRNALLALADAADALARLARAVADEAPNTTDPSRLLHAKDAAVYAGTSRRVIHEAVRSGALVAYGKQRDRAVRVSDLENWIESRRVKPTMGPDDADIERRIKELEAQGVSRPFARSRSGLRYKNPQDELDEMRRRQANTLDPAAAARAAYPQIVEAYAQRLERRAKRAAARPPGDRRP